MATYTKITLDFSFVSKLILQNRIYYRPKNNCRKLHNLFLRNYRFSHSTVFVLKPPAVVFLRHYRYVGPCLMTDECVDCVSMYRTYMCQELWRTAPWVVLSPPGTLLTSLSSRTTTSFWQLQVSDTTDRPRDLYLFAFVSTLFRLSVRGKRGKGATQMILAVNEQTFR